MSEAGQLEQHIRIQISADKLSAFIQFNRADDSFTCSPEALEQYVKDNGVIYGLHYDVIHKIAKDPKAYYYNQTLIAAGDPPLQGENGSIKLAYRLDDDSLHRPIENADGKVDLKEVNRINNVQRGQLIAERIAATQGKEGKSVTGIVLPGKNGKDARFKVGKNVVLNSDQTAMYSAIDGLMTKTDNDKINVFPVYEVNGDVDYRTGNIDFVGTVVIRGNVLTGFRVKAAGDIRVIGGVEGAELESDGSIEITGGVMAGDKGYLKANRNIKLSFVQDGRLHAGENIIVSQSIMHSQLKAGKSVVCSGAKGLIVGGCVQAGERVAARTIGNTMSTATVIEVGVLPDLRTELQELRTSIRQLVDGLDKTEKALGLLDQLASVGQLSDDKLALRVKLGATKRQTNEQIDTKRERILEIEKALEDTDLARVDVANVCYGGSKIVIGRYTRFVKDATKRCSFRLQDGEVTMISS
ncbi:hypothetical protein DFQ01_103325 [Paenibacillus cellulosilyticus]|uniref:Flagellar Assembly Protein A N-terminal region domain-containing protein n=1 Tax=Paenibacillus cellulosilyticus TaxID=375489 RepID=A0A2V2YXE9_9BACL|nr:FapA family protein [Paenibacillus cellulosilyticus]PWW06422.1 hypothetical protein DFQ01_103325 [Paenibacillus cellulosilyticus]QKS46232.1 DUF342 domain-containing protein [Paenibacillus cellulosilyticus]